MEFFIESPDITVDFELLAPQRRFYVSCPSGCEAHSQAYLLFGIMLKHVCATIDKLYVNFEEEIMDQMGLVEYYFDLEDFANTIKYWWNTKFLTAKDYPSWAGPLNGGSESMVCGLENFNLHYPIESGTQGWRVLNAKRLYLLSIDFLVAHEQCHVIKSPDTGRWVFCVKGLSVFYTGGIINAILWSTVSELADCLLTGYGSDVRGRISCRGKDIKRRELDFIKEETAIWQIRTETTRYGWC